jgi:hypothetical protein
MNFAMKRKVKDMSNSLMKAIMVGLTLLVLSTGARAEEVSREQIKGLDEQVQEIKSDVLSIAATLNQLEERLLYPSNTQVAVFVALAEGESFRLDSVEIQLDGKPVAHHLYTFKELEALRQGGVQRIYTGNIRSGGHDLTVSMLGKTKVGFDVKETGNFKVNKDVGPRFVEVTLSSGDIQFKDQ